MPRLPSSFYYGATPPFRPKLYLLVPENGDPRISLCELKLRSRRFTLHPTKGVRTPLDSPYSGEPSPDPSHLQTPGGTAETKTKTPRTPQGAKPKRPLAEYTQCIFCPENGRSKEKCDEYHT